MSVLVRLFVVVVVDGRSLWLVVDRSGDRDLDDQILAAGALAGVFQYRILRE